MENRITVIMSIGVTAAKGYFTITLYSQIYDSAITLFEKMWCIQRVRDLQGHRFEVK